MIVYRITIPAYAEELTASGNPARWNSKDVKLIYTAQSRALACLENIVHRSGNAHPNFLCLEIEVPDHLYITFLTKQELFPGWQRFENMHRTQHIGNQWIKEEKSAILQVPSVIIPDEYNFLINPRHKSFKDIRIIKREPFLFDERLLHR